MLPHALSVTYRHCTTLADARCSQKRECGVSYFVVRLTGSFRCASRSAAAGGMWPTSGSRAWMPSLREETENGRYETRFRKHHRRATLHSCQLTASERHCREVLHRCRRLIPLQTSSAKVLGRSQSSIQRDVEAHWSSDVPCSAPSGRTVQCQGSPPSAPAAPPKFQRTRSCNPGQRPLRLSGNLSSTAS